MKKRIISLLLALIMALSLLPVSVLPLFPVPRAALFAARPGSREHERNDK